MTKQEFYNTNAWKQLRAKKLTEQPMCQLCQLNGMNNPATQVHHAMKFFDQDDEVNRWLLLLDPDNLVSVCDKCHKAIHQPKRNILWPFQRQYLDNIKNYISQKYWDKGIIIKWINDDNRKGHK